MVEMETKIKVAERSRSYERYKDSGVEWLGEIPEHWEVKKLKHILKFTTGGTPSSHESGLYDGNEPWVTISDMEGRYITKSHFISKKGVKSAGIPLTPKDSLLYSFKLSVGQVAFSKINLYTNEAIASFHPTDNVCLNYWFYNLPSFIVKNANTNIYGAYILNQFLIKNSMLLVPPLKEQTAIAHFLDDKTTKIDEAITIKGQQITLLKERKQILIHKAVTQGLDENVPLKDSDVKWIGEIPEHWEVKKLFGLCRFVRGNSTFSKDELLSKGQYVALQYGKTYKVDEVDGKYNFYVNDEFYKDTQIVNYSDTIFISTSETIEDLGHSAFYNRTDLGLLGGEQLILKPDNEEINGHYLYFSSKVFSNELKKYATGIKVFRFNINDLKTIYTVVPPILEQKEISDYIETASQKIETAISLKQQEIAKLKEYKSSLINGVVTGKVKVC